MTASLHPAAPHDLPAFIAAPGNTDVLMIVMAVVLILAVLAVGLLFLRLHTLPERIAHRSHKLQFEIVAVLGLLALFTHIHAFWVAGLLLALIDLPDLGWPLRRMAGSLERIAGLSPGEGAVGVPNEAPVIDVPVARPATTSDKTVVPIKPGDSATAGPGKVPGHAGRPEDLSHA